MKTLTSFHGNDKGYILLISVIVLFLFSYLYLSFASYISIYKKTTVNYKKTVLEKIEKENQEVIGKYDL